MEQAWLDSLSEDWVSQPRSAGSPAPSLPSRSNSTSELNSSRAASSRIPKYDPQKQNWSAPDDSINAALLERSINDQNIPPSVRASQLLKSQPARGRRLSRALSVSSGQSSQCHTVQHKSVSVSPRKFSHHTPEWRRRLVHGEVAYGEQRDLFSAAGLETMFQPPSLPSAPSNPYGPNDGESSVMPSSPPPYLAECGVEQGSKGQAGEEAHRSRQLRGPKYKLVDESGGEFSGNDLSQSSNFRPAQACNQLGSGSSRGINESRPTRILSGQSDIRNEELSPIQLPRFSGDGKTDELVDISAEELKQKLEDLQEEDEFPEEADDDESSRLHTGNTTDDYGQNGHFVSLKRGGHSREGSFLKRMLSPSSLPAIDESALLMEESLQASTPKKLPIFPKSRLSNDFLDPKITLNSPKVSRTPHPSPRKGGSRGPGSPLKLFGTYDTFTNQKFLRRLSQFEGAEEQDEEIPSHVGDSTQPDMNYTSSRLEGQPEAGYQDENERPGPSTRRYSNFGQGDLDGYQFSEEVSYGSDEEDKENYELPVLDPTSQTRFKFQIESPTGAGGPMVPRSQNSKQTNTISTTKQTTAVKNPLRPGTGSSEVSTWQISQTVEDLETPRKRTGKSEGKRLFKSPLKQSTPKRRRTADKDGSQSHDDSSEYSSPTEAQRPASSVIGKKGKDTNYDNEEQAANPKVLALRQIIRPRTPTPSQRSSQQRDAAPTFEGGSDPIERAARSIKEEKIAHIQAELDAAHGRPMALGTSQSMYDDSRKGSVTTQDFLDEAKKIMAGIRGKARPRSGLTSVEESESDNVSANDTVPDEDDFDDSYQSTQEPFSRPPSREGAPVARLALQQQQNPELLNHLRKYQEMSDLDGIIASSMRSLAMAKDATISEREINRLAEETLSRASSRLLEEHSFIESDPPNVRLSHNPDLGRKRKHSASTVRTASNEQGNVDFPSRGSMSSDESVPTSRGSDSRRNIAPHAVSHLIPEQLAGMVFDRERNIWVKRKSITGEDDDGGIHQSDETEDDPFGDIPDLSVDETQELLRIKAVAARRKEEARVAQESSRLAIENGDRRNQDQSRHSSQESNPSSDPSDLTRDTKSHQTNTRLTSWGEEDSQVAEPASKGHTRSKSHDVKPQFREDIFHEEADGDISTLEPVSPSTPRRRRNVTISFSSPLTQEIEPPNYSDERFHTDKPDSNEDAANSLFYAGKVSAKDSLLIRKRSGKNRIASRSALRNSSRKVSIGGHQFAARPISRIEERDEESVSKANNERSVSVVMTPNQIRETSIVLATPRPAHEIGTLTLTPLSDFTMKHSEESFNLEVSYVERGQRFTLGDAGKHTLSNSIKELVEKLTEVEPYEPFWEHMKQVSLKERRLTTLHKLDEFCEHLEDLDLSNNQISQLNGAPSTLRNLKIPNNYLSDLTAFGHLSNLQYLDVSNNELESLSAFSGLIHLRSLRADNNRLTSLQGIANLNGLLSLRARGNLIESIDFAGTKLQKLTDMDLRSNRIKTIQNTQLLTSLSSLNLEENKLDSFSTEGHKLTSLRHLKLSGNDLEVLDVSQFPDLRLLYLDRNRLGTVSGLLRAKHIDSLSLREQQRGCTMNQGFISEAYEVRKLFLSGNLLTSFQPRVIFLNLQYLELANCGLQNLPDGFGQMLPNVRVLNLNFNALSDIRHLLGIVRLKRVHLAGNRLKALRMTTFVLNQFPLASADLRSNPLTIGFYPPVPESRAVVPPDGQAVVKEDPFTLNDASREKDDRYAERLDMDTRMLRRTYEILMVGGCARLRALDGLKVDKELMECRDMVWDRLVQDGIVRIAMEGDRNEEGEISVELGRGSEGKEREETVTGGPDGIFVMPHPHVEEIFDEQ